MIEGNEKLTAFGKRLKHLRNADKKTQQFMADLLECTTSNYQKFEYGQVNIPITTLLALADYFGVTTDYLLDRRLKNKEKSVMLRKKEIYTYQDICKTDEGELYELIDGEVYKMDTPFPDHAFISSELCCVLGNCLDKKTCCVFHAPVDVLLFNQPDDPYNEIKYLVLPDIVVVCDRKQFGRRGIYGPPKLVVEVLSESTRQRDRLTKYNLYQQAGVEQYWMIDPCNSTVIVFTLENGKYLLPEVYTKEQVLHSDIFPDLSIDLSKIFDSSWYPITKEIEN